MPKKTVGVALTLAMSVVPAALLAADEFAILVGRKVLAERVNVVTGGGHFPVLIRLDNGNLRRRFAAAIPTWGSTAGWIGRVPAMGAEHGAWSAWWMLPWMIATPPLANSVTVAFWSPTSLTVAMARRYSSEGTQPGRLYTVRSLDRGGPGRIL